MLIEARPFRVSLVVAVVTAVACALYARWLNGQLARAVHAASQGVPGVTAGDTLRLSEWANVVGWSIIVAPCLIVLLGLGLTWATRPERVR